jgi:intein/homing endonuclease
MESIIEVKRRYEKELLKLANVVGVGIRYKEVQGKRTDKLSIAVYVSKKLPIEKLDPKDVVPKTLENYPTDVVEVGIIKPLQSRTSRWRPYLGGISIGHYQITAGTLGCRVYDVETGRRCILSNNHVLANSDCEDLTRASFNDAILQPGPYDGGTLEDRIAGLYKWVKLKRGGQVNYVDCALALPDNDADLRDDILDIGVPSGVNTNPYLGMRVKKSGRTTGLTTGEITDLYATVQVVYDEPIGTLLFEDQIITTCMSQPGDSVTGDARMYYLENGNLKFGTVLDVFNSFKSGNEVEVLSVKKVCRNYPNGYPSIRTGVVCFSKVVDAVYHGVKPVWKVTLHNGKTIEVTKDHSLFTAPNFWSMFIPRKLEELDRVVSVDDYGFEGIALPYDDDLLTFLGLWIADGSYVKKDGKVIGLSISTGNDGELVKWLSDFTKRYRRSFFCHKIREIWNENPSLTMREVAEKGVRPTTEVLKYKSKGDYRIWSKELANVVYSLFGDVDCYTKRVPNAIFVATKRQIAAFLKGYFSGDGSIHLHGDCVTVDCASVNRDLLEDIQELLSRLGIKSNIDSGYMPRLSKLRQYKLKIDGRISVQKFLNTVGFIKKLPEEILEALSQQPSKAKKDYPFSTRGIRQVDFVGYKPVYDFKVNPTESFVANGILCHNSGSLLCDENNSAVGLLFAGSSSITVYNKISRVMEALKQAFGFTLKVRVIDKYSRKPVEKIRVKVEKIG